MDLNLIEGFQISRDSSSKSSVHFCEEVQVFLVPSRKEETISCFRKTPPKSNFPKQKITFDNQVTVLIIPSRSEIEEPSIMNLWYTREDIINFEKESHEELDNT